VAKPKPEPVSLPARTVQPNRRVVRVESEPKIETQPAIATGNPADDLIPPPDKTEAEAPKRSSFQGIGPENRKTGQGVTTTAASPRIISESTAAGFSRYSYHSPSELKPGDHAQAERYFARGARDYQNGRYADAAQAYRTATGLDPAYFDAYYNLGVAANAAGNLRQSLEAYEYALALKPDSVNARYNFALTLTRANYPVDAANELLKILASNPSDGRAHLALANLYAQQFHQPDNAREQYLQVLQYDPNNSQATAIRFWLKTHPR
ncbi:MAG TPA: tetratricopeptide repeat protein, partial [Verrucomicrobiae bacterium]|nr:tetratricopeptide repeat protein [Verrucomicrobiae bacterium]